jgi:hypothetical protein
MQRTDSNQFAYRRFRDWLNCSRLYRAILPVWAFLVLVPVSLSSSIWSGLHWPAYSGFAGLIGLFAGLTVSFAIVLIVRPLILRRLFLTWQRAHPETDELRFSLLALQHAGPPNQSTDPMP